MSEIRKCCMKCGYAMPDEIEHCPACGAKQKMSKPRQSVSNTAAFLIVGASTIFLAALIMVIS
jgi:uncharacterized paraquat-inducible protein A